MTRPMPRHCEVCGKLPPQSGIGFPDMPNAIPGLPAHLRGACIYVCATPACEIAAQKRAVTAVPKLKLKQLWRHHVIGARKGKTHVT